MLKLNACTRWTLKYFLVEHSHWSNILPRDLKCFVREEVFRKVSSQFSSVQVFYNRVSPCSWSESFFLHFKSNFLRLQYLCCTRRAWPEDTPLRNTGRIYLQEAPKLPLHSPPGLACIKFTSFSQVDMDSCWGGLSSWFCCLNWLRMKAKMGHYFTLSQMQFFPTFFVLRSTRKQQRFHAKLKLFWIFDTPVGHEFSPVFIRLRFSFTK